jgi:hypothetical protein
MKRYLNIRNAAVLIASLALLYGCMNLATLGIGRVIRPEDSKHFEVKGAIVAVHIDTYLFPQTITVMLMFADTASFSMYVPNDDNYILMDVPLNCTGISRTGVIWQVQTGPEFFDNTCKFKLESNKVNYLGRYVLQQDLSTFWDKMTVTNTLEHDKAAFIDIYPVLSNMDFVSVPVSNGLFRTE